MSNSDNIVDIAEQAAIEIRDGYADAERRGERKINGWYEIRVPALAGRNVAALDVNPDGPLDEYIWLAGSQSMPYGHSTGHIIAGIGFRLESAEGAYTGKAYLWRKTS